MLWSLLNSAKGKSALHSSAPSYQPAIAPAPPAPSSHVIAAPPTATAAAIRPERCCVYCGHALYAAPRTPRIRCPGCFQEMPLKDIALSGEICEERILTAGRITISQDARVQAELVAGNIEIAGRVLGNVLASQCCRLHSTAKVAGNILCRQLRIDPGAVLEGQLELVRESQNQQS